MKNYIRNMKNYQKIWLKQGLFWFLFLLGLSLSAYGGFLSFISQKAKQEIQVDDTFVRFKPLKESISANAYLVGDLSTGKILLAKNQDFHFFPASLSKLMTGVIVIDNFQLQEPITLSAYSISTEGNEGNLQIGESLTTYDLLQVLLISSSNDAAVAFAESLGRKGINFIDLMNAKAQEWQMNNTAFFGETGLDRKGNFTTAHDLFILSRQIYFHYPLLGEITQKAEETVFSLNTHLAHHLKNTNVLVGQLPGLWLSKTGSTPEAKDCLLTIFEFPFKNGKIPIGIVVLNSNDRFGDTVKLYHWVQNLLKY